ncbi:MAG TPA: hypothetical protein VNL15_05550 [Dehalococcoidia bacterium]|nr:hypothetical protein [Dehalococcoidia bacterium]
MLKGNNEQKDFEAMAAIKRVGIALGILPLLLAACGDPAPRSADQGTTTPPSSTEETLVMFPVEGTTIQEFGQYLFEVDTGRLWKLEGGGIFWPFSPDGKFLIQNRCCGASLGLNVIDLSTGKSRRILEGILPYAVWSPDGRKIGFIRVEQIEGRPVSDRLEGPYLIDKDGSNLVHLSQLPVPSSISWSPDGKFISAETYPDMPRKLILLNTASGEVTTAIESLAGVAWSPDGGLVAYLNENGLHVYDPETRLHRKLAADPSGDPLSLRGWSYPIWSPDGSKLLFRFPIALNVIYSEDSHIYYLANLQNPGLIGDIGPARNPVWSPDGRQIAYLSEGCVTDSWDIYLYDVDSGFEKRLTATPKVLKEGPVWWPSGNSLLFSTFDKLYRIDIESGELKTLVTSVGNGISVHLHSDPWSPDGRYLGIGSSAHGICD